MSSLDLQHSVAKFAGSSKIDRGIVDGSVFIRRPVDTDGLSVNWLECFAAPRANQIAEICARSRLKLSKNGRFAEVKVEDVVAAVADHIDGFDAIQDPLAADEPFPEDPSHSLFLGLPDPAEELAQTVGDAISMCVSALHPPAT